MFCFCEIFPKTEFIKAFEHSFKYFDVLFDFKSAISIHVFFAERSNKYLYRSQGCLIFRSVDKHDLIRSDSTVEEFKWRVYLDSLVV